MGTSEHAYGLIMKALYQKTLKGQGTRIDLAMFESSVSWLTVPITMTASFGKHSTRRGNTHEFFSPVSVYRSKDGFIYMAVGNDRQWQALVSLAPFKSLAAPIYQHNKGRIADVNTLNQKISAITVNHTSADLIDMLTSITVPVSEIKPMEDVVADPLTARRLLFTRDPVTGTKITLAPPPYMTPYLEASQRQMTFPPRFGEHNKEIYTRIGYKAEDLEQLKARGVI
jgi:formyl-CoA transferase